MAQSDMLTAAEAEVERLEAELAATEAYQKLQLARQVVALYRGLPKVEIKIGGHSVTPRDVATHLHRERVHLTKTARIELAATEYLRTKGARAPASELLDTMAKNGIEIGGKEPVKALSAYLSNTKSLNNVREFGGYGLAAWGSNRGPELLTKTGA